MARADVVIVTYDSRNQIRSCVESLLHPELSVIVVDNNSTDGTVDELRDLPVRVVHRRDNLGFAFASNAGAAAGTAPFVVFLNPDTEARPDAILGLAAFLEEHPEVGAVGPLILDENGGHHLSQRRFSNTGRSLASALFLPRLVPTASWSVDIADANAYARPGSPDWISGACIAVPRPLLESIGGLDDRFFMYGEDMDLCRRIREAGYDVRFEPSLSIVHIGGASTPRSRLIGVMTESKILYAEKHGGRSAELAERSVSALHAVTHAALTTRGAEARRGHLRSLSVALRDGIGKLGRDATGSPRRLPPDDLGEYAPVADELPSHASR